MKKQVWLGMLIVVLLAASVMPVMAEGGKNQIRWQGNVFALVGEVTAIDGEAKTITVKVYTGNGLMKADIGQELTIATGPKTQFLLYGEAKCTVMTFGDVAKYFEDAEKPLYISANGKLITYEAAPDAFVATRITVDVPLHYGNQNH